MLPVIVVFRLVIIKWCYFLGYFYRFSTLFLTSEANLKLFYFWDRPATTYPNKNVKVVNSGTLTVLSAFISIIVFPLVTDIDNNLIQAARNGVIERFVINKTWSDDNWEWILRWCVIVGARFVYNKKCYKNQHNLLLKFTYIKIQILLIQWHRITIVSDGLLCLSERLTGEFVLKIHLYLKKQKLTFLKRYVVEVNHRLRTCFCFFVIVSFLITKYV